MGSFQSNNGPINTRYISNDEKRVNDIKSTAVGQEWDLIESSLVADASRPPTGSKRNDAWSVDIFHHSVSTQKTGSMRVVPVSVSSTVTPLNMSLVNSPSNASMPVVSIPAYPLNTISVGESMSGTGTLTQLSRLDVLQELGDISSVAIAETGMFCNCTAYLDQVRSEIYLRQDLVDKATSIGFMVQKGILRTNCIDCLDRTNVAQFALGMKFLAISLRALGLTDRYAADPSSPMLMALMDMYSEMGDRIALQYGGSEAHKKVSAGQGPGKKQQGELLTSIKRYYSNAFTDTVKQDAMNIFLGCYIPSEKKLPLWDLETDYYLHNKFLRPPTPLVDKILFSDENRMEGFPDAEPGHSDTENVDKLFKEVPSSLMLVDEHSKNKYIINLDEHDQRKSNVIMDSLLRSEKRKYVASIMNTKVREAMEFWWRNSIKLNEESLQRVLYSLRSQSISPTSNNATIKDNVQNEVIVKSKIHTNVGTLANPDFERKYEIEELTLFDEMLSAEFLSTMDSKTSLAMTWGVGGPNKMDKQRKPILSGNQSGRYRINSQNDMSKGLDSIDEEDIYTTKTSSKDGTEAADKGIYEGSSMYFIFQALGGNFASASASASASTSHLPSALNQDGQSYEQIHINTDHFSQDPNRIGVTDNSSNTQINVLHPELERQISTQSISKKDDGRSFQLGKYVREIGLKARTLVGGFLKRDSVSQNIANRSIHDQEKGVRYEYFDFFSSNHNNTSAATNLYSHYVEVANDNFILFDSTNVAAEQDFEISLRELNVDVDNVKEMENLAYDNCIHTIAPDGLYEGAEQNQSAVASSAFLFSSMINAEDELKGIHFTDDPLSSPIGFKRFDSQNFVSSTTYIDPLSARSNPDKFDQYHGLRSPYSKIRNPTKLNTMPMIQVPSAINQKLVSVASQAGVCTGLSNELQRMAFKYLLQKTMYTKEINIERLSKRLSYLSSERVILDYISYFEKDAIVPEIDEITYMAMDSTGHNSFDELERTLSSLFYQHQQYVIKKMEVLAELQSVSTKTNRNQDDKTSETKLDTDEYLTSSTLDKQMDDKINEIMKSRDRENYPGLTYITSDVYFRTSNPCLLMNEIAAIGFSRFLNKR